MAQKTSERGNDKVYYDIVESIGVISTSSNGWTREVNLVAWNGGRAKYDIRDWDPKHESMSKGVTLYPDEMKTLLGLLSERNFDAEVQAG